MMSIQIKKIQDPNKKLHSRSTWSELLVFNGLKVEVDELTGGGKLPNGTVAEYSGLHAGVKPVRKDSRLMK